MWLARIPLAKLIALGYVVHEVLKPIQTSSTKIKGIVPF